jgi:hypothetical protein
MLRFFDRLNLTPAERRLVVVILAVAFVVVNYWIVWPRFDDFRQISDEMTSMHQKQQIYEREIARRPTYELTLRKLQAEGSVLPPGEERIQFRSDMERLAREVGLTVPQWGQVLPERSGGQGTNAFFEAITLTMNRVSGTEAQFVDFLYRVGASNSTIRVKELSLAPGNFDQRAQGRTNLVAVSIKLVASVQKAAPLGASATPVAAAPGSPDSTSVARSALPAPSRTNVPAPAALRTNFPVPVRLLSRTNVPAKGMRPGS